MVNRLPIAIGLTALLGGVAVYLMGQALSLVLRNRSAGTVDIDWLRTVLVDSRGEAHRVMHKGVKLADRSAAQPPSVVPSGATITDFVFPADSIVFRPLGSSSYWSAPPLFEFLAPGSAVTLSIGLRTETGSLTRTFTFAVKP